MVETSDPYELHYSELQSDFTDRLFASVDRKLDQAWASGAKCDEEITKFVSIANSGGATAVLSYMAIVPATEQVNTIGSLAVLACFVVGVICAGFSLVIARKVWMKLHSDLLNKKMSFINNEISLQEMQNVQAAGISILEDVLQWTSLSLFALGAIVGVGGAVATVVL